MTDPERSLDVREQLATKGLLSRQRASRSLHADSGDPTSTRLREALEEQGPLFGAFGQYLSSRVDLLPLRDCLELGKLRLSVGTTPLERVGNTLTAELGAPVDELFSAFDELPLRTTLLHQWHRADLADGEPVIVKLIRPDSVERIHSDLKTLPVLEEMRLGSPPWDGLDLREIVEDFVVWIERQLDMRRELEALEDLAEHSDHFDALEVPEIYGRLSSSRVLVVEDLEGTGLDTLAARPAASDDDRGELARRLCSAWLQQALLGDWCIEGPLASNLSVLRGDRFAIGGGVFSEMDSRWCRNIRGAVIATAREDPDRACARLLEECSPEADDDQRQELQNLFRQAEPFRSGGWTERFKGRRLADSLFVQWRLLRAVDVRPKAHLLSFMRGLAEVENLARALSPDRDALAEAADDLRVVTAAVEVREQLAPTRFARQLEQYAPVLRDLLTNGDRLARELRQGRVRLRLERSSSSDENGPRRVEWPVFAGALFVLMAVAMIGVELVRAHPGTAWIEALTVMGFVAISCILFWVVARSTRGRNS
jgi:ubiquinone biosynthesis protein